MAKREYSGEFEFMVALALVRFCFDWARTLTESKYPGKWNGEAVAGFPWAASTRPRSGWKLTVSFLRCWARAAHPQSKDLVLLVDPVTVNVGMLNLAVLRILAQSRLIYPSDFVESVGSTPIEQLRANPVVERHRVWLDSHAIGCVSRFCSSRRQKLLNSCSTPPVRGFL